MHIARKAHLSTLCIYQECPKEKHLAKLRLQLVPEAECLYINNKLIIFFFVKDIAILNRTINASTKYVRILLNLTL